MAVDSETKLAAEMETSELIEAVAVDVVEREQSSWRSTTARMMRAIRDELDERLPPRPTPKEE